MDIKELLGKLAPTVASALLGPAGGVAVAALGTILGIPDATPQKLSDIISKGQMTGEQIAEIKKLELQFANEEKERGFKYADLEFKDVDSARNREIKTGDSTNKILAFTVLGAFILVIFGTLLGIGKADTVLAGTLIGYLSAKAEQVLAYYFGSSSGSKAKTELLAKAEAIK